MNFLKNYKKGTETTNQNKENNAAVGRLVSFWQWLKKSDFLCSNLHFPEWSNRINVGWSISLASYLIRIPYATSLSVSDHSPPFHLQAALIKTFQKSDHITPNITHISCLSSHKYKDQNTQLFTLQSQPVFLVSCPTTGVYTSAMTNDWLFS